MYRIIGADDKEYGPVDAGKIRQWLHEGRLNRLSRVRPEGDSDWEVIGARVEFADLFPPLPVAASKPADPAEMCGLARASLICGGLGFTGLGAIAGLVLGLAAHARIRQSEGRLSGSTLATAGIVLSLIFMLLWLLAVPAVLLLSRLPKSNQKVQSIQCMNNIKQLDLAVLRYASDHKDVLPSAASWCDDITQYVGSPKPFLCPAGDASQRGHYAFNAKLAGLDSRRITRPASTVLIFESERGWNASGGEGMILKTPRHGQGVVVGFADGHTEVVPQARRSQLNWEP